MAEFRLLGEFTARVGDRSVDLGPARQRCVLAALAVDVNHVVPDDRLAVRVWGADPPRRARETLSTYISRLRQALATLDSVTLVRRSGGYALQADPAMVDYHRFRELCAAARVRAGHDEDIAALLTEGVALWHGEALTGLAGDWAVAERGRLQQELFTTQQERVDALLRLGHGEGLVDELRTQVRGHPLNERLAAQYMLALYRAGRAADALGHYRGVTADLREQLGVDPDVALRTLHGRILNTDQALSGSPAAATAASEAQAVPRQLSVAPRWFTGRTRELSKLTEALSFEDRACVAVVCGVGGTGKTSLALRWAYQHLDRFPDGQLQVCLRGFGGDGEPMSPSTALRGFLAALGVAAAAVPDDLDVQASLYRSLLADRRMLVVLDDARDAAQVRPLLPGSPTCKVVVTSRRRLPRLVGEHGAQPIDLGMLDAGESHTLLSARLGSAWLASEPATASELLGYCAGLPLALSMVSARVTTQPALSLDDVVGELRDTSVRLHALDHGEVSAGLESVFAASCAALRPPVATVFTLLGVLPGPDCGVHTVASAAAIPIADARRVLRELDDANLLLRSAADRFRQHDLVRLYARERARAQLPPAVVTGAMSRVIGYYVHTAYRAQRYLNPHRPPLEFADPPERCTLPPISDTAAALHWFGLEYQNLLAAQETAEVRHDHTAVWQIAWSLTPYQRWHGNHDDNVTVCRKAARAAEHDGGIRIRSRTRRWLGHACAKASDFDAARHHLRHALDLAQRCGDRVDQAYARHSLALAFGWQGRHADALEHAASALALFEELGNPIWTAEALNTAGWYHECLGDHATARSLCRRALDINHAHAYGDGEAHALDSLGSIARRSGRYAEAVGHYGRALAVRRTLGDRYGEATTSAQLAELHTLLGDRPRASTAWQQALRLYQEHGCLAEAKGVHDHLMELG